MTNKEVWKAYKEKLESFRDAAMEVLNETQHKENPQPTESVLILDWIIKSIPDVYESSKQEDEKHIPETNYEALVEKFKIGDWETDSLEIENPVETLRQLMIDNPDLPLVILAGDHTIANDCKYLPSNIISCEVGEFLDCKQRYLQDVFTDREYFRDVVDETLFDALFYPKTKSEVTLDATLFYKAVDNVVAQYDQYWKSCILVKVDNK